MNLSIQTSPKHEMKNEKSIFSNEQLYFIDEIKLPKIVRFIRADKFDDDFLNPSKNIWEFKYSGNSEKISFKDMNHMDVKIIKFILIKYIYKNSPSHLGNKFAHLKNSLNISTVIKEELILKNLQKN